MSGPGPGPGDWDEGSPERLYVITGGRSAAAGVAVLDLVTLIVSRSVPQPGQQPEHAAILRMCRYPLSMAEISAYLRLPFSAVAVLVADLVADDRVEARAPLRAVNLPDPELIKAVMYGLQRL
jgi:Protein of unknown function (DUF742)